MQLMLVYDDRWVRIPIAVTSIAFLPFIALEGSGIRFGSLYIPKIYASEYSLMRCECRAWAFFHLE